LDEQYTWMSVATLLAIGYILYEFGFVNRTAVEPAGHPVEPAVLSPEASAPAPVRRKHAARKRR
jgi:hypothetical protein